MKSLFPFILILLSFQGIAQVELTPILISSLEDEFMPYAQTVSTELSVPALLNKTRITNLKMPKPEERNIGFGASSDKPLNRNLGFNNEIPAWIKYNDPTRDNFSGLDKSLNRADGHGILPSTIQRTYLDAEDLQREPIPKKE